MNYLVVPRSKPSAMLDIVETEARCIWLACQFQVSGSKLSWNPTCNLETCNLKLIQIALHPQFSANRL
jgi:hypothetical protein